MEKVTIIHIILTVPYSHYIDCSKNFETIDKTYGNY